MTNNYDIEIQPGTKSGEEASEMGICMGVVAKIGHIKLQFNGNMMINNEFWVGFLKQIYKKNLGCIYNSHVNVPFIQFQEL